MQQVEWLELLKTTNFLLASFIFFDMTKLFFKSSDFCSLTL